MCWSAQSILRMFIGDKWWRLLSASFLIWYFESKAADSGSLQWRYARFLSLFAPPFGPLLFFYLLISDITWVCVRFLCVPISWFSSTTSLLHICVCKERSRRSGTMVLDFSFTSRMFWNLDRRGRGTPVMEPEKYFKDGQNLLNKYYIYKIKYI
jgi:hypothetical protein